MENTTRIAYLNINDIYIDDYQRPVNVDKVSRIASSYEPHKDRPIEVSYRDGRYYCFDGQHRLLVHKLLGKATIQAQIHEGLTYTQEASLFSRQHDNEQRVNCKDRWEASVKAADDSPRTQEIINICKEIGFRISNRQDKSENTICCVQEIQTIYDKYGADGLRTVLKFVKSAWDAIPGNTNRTILRALSLIYKCCGDDMLGDTRWKLVTSKLSKVSPRFLMKQASMNKRKGGKGVARQIVEYYNKGLAVRSKNRINIYMIY